MEIVGILFLSVICLYFVIKSYIKDRDIFNPTTFTLLFTFVTNIPFLLIIFFDKSEIDLKIFSKIFGTNMSKDIGEFAILLAIGMFFFVIGVSNSKEIDFKLNDKYQINGNKFLITSVIAIIITIIAYLKFLNGIGGLRILISNLEKRAEFTNGNGALLLFTNTLIFIVISLVYNKNYKINILYKILLAISFMLFLSINITLGGRKPILFVILLILLTINYSIKKVRIMNFKTLILSLILLIYIIAVPIIRQPDLINNLLEDPSSFQLDVKESSFKQIKDISYVNTYIYIYSHFKYNDKWYGKVFLNLGTSFIPSTLIDNKPPVDEGVYIKSLLENYRVEPNDGFNNLYPSSLPPETFGNGYMNFGILGVILFFYLLGFIKGTLYKILIKNRNIYFTFIYGYFLFNFQISNLRIVQTFSICILFTLWYLFIIKIRKGEY